MVSVIMPAYNGEKFVHQAIESVIMQTYENWELIIIDDGSTDNTVKIIEQFEDKRIRFYKNNVNMGIAYSRNRALYLSKGAYIALLDDDDMYVKDKLRLQVEYLDDHKNIDILGGKCQWIDEKNQVLSSPSQVLYESDDIRALSLFFNPFWNGEIMFRKKIYEYYKFFYKNGMYGMEDYHFWVRYLKYCKATNLNQVIFLHRQTSGTETNRVKKTDLDNKRNVMKYIRKITFANYGFSINDIDYEMLYKYYNDKGIVSFCSIDEMFEMIKLFKNICALNTQIPDANLKKICRLLICQSVMNSNEIWW